MIKLEYWHSSDIAEIFYQKGFRQRLYIDSEMIGKEWPVKKDGSEDGAGMFKLLKGRCDKIYSLKFVATEYIVDALQLAQIHDTIFITNEVGETSKVLEFTIKATLQDSNFYLIEADVFCEYFLVMGCGNNLALASCYTNTANDVKDKILTTNAIYTLPLSNGVHTGDRYIVTNSGGQGKIYQYSTKNGWVDTKETYTKAIVLATTPSVYYWYDGNAWRRYAQITSSVLQGAHVYKTKGICLPKTFVQLQYLTVPGVWVDSGSPTWAETFRYAGIISTIPPTGIVLLRVKCYTHNCNYGYSDALGIIVAP